MKKIALFLLLIATISPLFSQTTTFFRGINVNGPAVVIDGNQWQGDDAGFFECHNTPLTIKNLDLKPTPGKNERKMLQTFRWSNQANLIIRDVPRGTYSVRAYILEDNNAEQFSIFVNDLPAQNNFTSGPAGTWKKAGPWIVDVKGGEIQISSSGGAANFCGIEIRKGAAEMGKKLHPVNAPESPYLGRFPDQKPRLVVMTDIGGDPDDRQSLVRFLLHSCDVDLEGFCTGFGHGHYENTRPDLIHQAINAYAQVYENLRKHNRDYPTPNQLHALVKDGHNGDPHKAGPGMESEASRWIEQVLLKKDPRPVWFSIWGGPRELAQAIWQLERKLPGKKFAGVLKKIRVHSIADQDRTAGWIKKNYPGIFWIYSRETFRGMYRNGDPNLVSPNWLKQHVLQNHGPLGNVYPENAAGKKGVKEGDTPSFLYVIPNGLSDPEAPQWGNWGGRFRYSGTGREFIDAFDNRNGERSPLASVFRWREAYQNDFEARMDWCVQSPENANHPPEIRCNRKKGTAVIHMEGSPGEKIKLNAKGSKDPDGDDLNVRWWIYREPSACGEEIAIANNEKTRASILLPKNSGGETIHVILEVTDTGNPPLTRYRRIIVRVKDK